MVASGKGACISHFKRQINHVESFTRFDGTEGNLLCCDVENASHGSGGERCKMHFCKSLVHGSGAASHNSGNRFGAAFLWIKYWEIFSLKTRNKSSRRRHKCPKWVQTGRVTYNFLRRNRLKIHARQSGTACASGKWADDVQRRTLQLNIHISLEHARVTATRKEQHSAMQQSAA